MSLKLQKKFFDVVSHRYPEALIIHPPLHTQLETAAIISRLKSSPTATVADFGAGSGRISIPLLQERFKVWSIDISSASLNQIGLLAKILKLPAPYFSTDLQARPRFSSIVGADILHHVPLDKYLPLIHAALKPGGQIIFSEPGAWNPSWYIYLSLFFDWQVEKGVVTCSYFSLHRSLKNAGFKNIRLTGLGLLPRPFFNSLPYLLKLNDWLGSLPLLKLFAYRYIVEATQGSLP
ncbi:MAG: class I SAM-dependent methyltransferase [Nitrospira sp.]|nr:class I SAM-dependent methyltransferase [Nitrospira sp.]